MLCPEVWKFSPPDVSVNTDTGSLLNEKSKRNVVQTVETHYFNHLVSVVIPDTGPNNFPQKLNDLLAVDCDYYKVVNLKVQEFINAQFIDGFIKKGLLYVLSINTNIDTDNCVAITPCGKLVLSLQKETYQELGLEGKLSYFCRKDHNRFVVHVDLKSDAFKPGKKNYERVKWCLTENFKPITIIFLWIPNDLSVCPSSVASYFNSMKYEVLLCEPKLTSRTDYSVEVHLFNNSPKVQFCTVDELFEWIGLRSINGNLELENYEYLSSYQTPEENKTFGQVAFLQSVGFYAPEQIKKIFDELRFYLTRRPHLPWISLHVQGFSDSPVSWKLKEHQYYTNGDNCYTIVIKPDEEFALQTIISSNKKPK